MADLYAELGLSRGASEKEIKSAFRKLAKRYHPDHNPNDKSAQHKFAKISQAYEILSDNTKKAQYDRGEIDSEGKPVFQGFSGANNSHNYSSANFNGMNFDAGDIFRDLFGTSKGRASQFKHAINKNINAELSISLENIVNNSKIEVALPNGKNVKIQLPKYVEDGQVIRLRGQGEQIYSGAPGDALVTLRIKKHPVFEVQGVDLFMEQKLDLKDAVNGGKLFVETLENKLALNIPPWTDSGKLFRLKDKGLPAKGGERGDLYVKVQISLPKEYETQLKELFNTENLC